MQLLQDQDRSKPFERLDAEQAELLGEILDQLLVQAEAGHPPQVEEACQRHPELASAIRHYVRSMQMLHHAAHAKPLSSIDDSRIDLLAPPERQLGDYRLVREIGRGGMGIVYEAQQLSLSRRVALKILPFAAVLDGRQITRFQNEAQAAASLHHPHIVPVYAVGHERGTYYYSMQYIDGQTLEFAIDQMRQGREGSLFGLPSQQQMELRNASTIIAHRSHGHSVDLQPVIEPSTSSRTRAADSTVRMNADASTIHSIRSRDYVRRVAQIGVQAAEALHYAHQHGIVHRDIKPSNLMLDASGNLWVTDFGLAQCATSHSLTRSGDVVGTLRYMSPEQAAGRSHLIDHRTDVYGLGATLYELLTLRAVVDSRDKLSMVRQLEGDAPRGLRRYNSAVPIDLENIVLKSIAKNREERYTSAEELAADLQRFLGGQTPLARRPTLLDHGARWVRRHAKGVAVAGFVALVLIVTSLASVLMLQAKNREIERAQAQAESHLLRANEAIYQFGHSLMHRLELLPGSEQVRLDTARDTIAYFRAFASYAHNRSLLHADVARALMICGDLELQIGEAATAVDHYRQAHDLWSRLDSVDRPANQLLCLNNLAKALMQLGQLDNARATLLSALHSQSADEQSQSPEIQSTMALLHLNLGQVLTELQENRLARSSITQALKLIDQLRSQTVLPSPARHRERWQQQVDALLAVALLQSGQTIQDPEQARSLLERAVALSERRQQADPNDRAVLHDLSLARMALGAAWMSSGQDREESRRLFQKASADLRQLHQQNPSVEQLATDLASALNNLGQVALESNAYSDAEVNFRESKSLLERLHRSSQDYWVASNLGGVCNNLAVVKEHQGLRQQAEQLLKEAIGYQELALAQAPDSARCREFLAEHRAQLARLFEQQP